MVFTFHIHFRYESYVLDHLHFSLLGMKTNNKIATKLYDNLLNLKFGALSSSGEAFNLTLIF